MTARKPTITHRALRASAIIASASCTGGCPRPAAAPGARGPLRPSDRIAVSVHSALWPDRTDSQATPAASVRPARHIVLHPDERDRASWQRSSLSDQEPRLGCMARANDDVAALLQELADLLSIT